MSADDLLQGYRRLQRRLEEDLRVVGDPSTHGPTIGHEREDRVAAALVEHTFQPITTRRGQISAPADGPSAEWDIIVCDAGAPGLVGVLSALPIESVLATVSVKSRLDATAIAQCAEAAAQLRAMASQDGADCPVPSVFAFGLDGARSATLQAALNAAIAKHGVAGMIDGILVLGRYTILTTDGADDVREDEDAYCRWIAAIDTAIQHAPRRPLSLAPYVAAVASAQPPAGVDEAEPPDDDGGGAVPIAPPWPSRPRGGEAIALRDRRDEPDLTASRTTARLVAEVAADDPAAADRLRAALSQPDPSAALSELALGATGSLADALGRLLMALDREAQAAELFERLAAEGGPERPRALANGATAWRAAGKGDRAAPLLDEARAESPDHPAVRFTDISALDDPAQRLQQLEGVDVTTARDLARLAAIRGESLSELDRDAEAVEEVRDALAGYWTADLAERAAILLTRSAGAAVREDDDNARGELHEAVAVLDDLVDEALALGQPANAMQFERRLLQALRRLGRHDLVSTIAAYWAPRAHRGDATARTVLAAVLLDALEPEAARTVAPPELPNSVDGRLLDARLALMGPGGEPADSAAPETAASVATLDALLQEHLPLHERVPVAEARAMAAADGLADWSDAAGAIIAEQSAFYADMLRARHLAITGREQEAQALLLGHADGPDGIRALIDLAVEAGHWDRVVALVEDGLGDRAPEVERLRRADALARLGRTSDAEAAYRELATATDATPFMAERAWFQLTTSLTRRRQWEVLAAAARDWYEHRPESPLALWATADALARTGAAEEAWRLVVDDGRGPDAPGQRRLVAQLAAQALPLAEALERIAALSDAVGRTDEQLEASLITLSAGRDKEHLEPALAARVKQTFADFTERFPESRIVRSVKAPDTEEEWLAFAERELAERRRLAGEIDQSVARGDAPLATFGRIGGTALSIWLDAEGLPLVAPVDEMAVADRDAAEQAIAGPAVWDTSVLAVLGLLPDDVAATLARALPASSAPRVAHAEIEDLDRLLADRDPQRSPGSLTLERGRPVIVERTAEQLQVLRTRVDRIRGLATRLTVADPDLAGPGDLAAALRDADLHAAATSFTSALLLAHQRGVPLFSDDRVVRTYARAMGVPAFGTVALVHAAADRGLIAPAARTEALWALRAAGGHTLPAERGELLERLTADDYAMTPAVKGLLRDRDAWLNDPGSAFARWHDVLHTVWTARPDELPAWVAHTIAQVSATVGTPRPVTATALLLPALGPAERDVGYVRAVLAAMRRCNLVAFDVGDPLVAAFSQMTAQQDVDEEANLVALYVIRALSRVPITEAQRLLRLGL